MKKMLMMALVAGTTYGQVATELKSYGVVDRQWEEDGKPVEVLAFDFYPCPVEFRRMYVRFTDGKTDKWFLEPLESNAMFVCDGNKVALYK